MKKLLAVVISMVMIITMVSSVTAAILNKYMNPTITPPANMHPRVMFREQDISTIKANMATSVMQNTAAVSHFKTLISGSYDSVSIGNKGTWIKKDNYNFADENKIEAFAFDYAINGNEASGNTAVARLIEYLGKVQYSNDTDLSYRYAGAVVFKAAEVYDWCYPLLDESEKNSIISGCEDLMKTYFEIGYPPTGQDAIQGHGSEAQLLRDMLAFGIAVYDERPDIYNAAMGRIQEEYVPARNDYYRSEYIHQGTEYGWYRFAWDLYAELLVEKMSGGTKTLFDTELMENVLYGMIYARRPDGRFFTEGDNKVTDRWYYNNFNQQTAKLAADLFDNEYFKGEYRKMRASGEDFTNSNNNDERSFNSVYWLIMNDPSVAFQEDRSALPKSKYFGSPVGKIYAKTDWGYTKGGAKDYGVAAAEMKIGERFSANHDHLDAGTFQLYFRAPLTGDFGAQDNYNSDFDLNYYRRTVAHNALTIYDSTESFRNDSFSSIANDGGQLIGYGGTLNAWKNEAPYKRSSVVNQSIAKDNSYSYIKGDLTAAYKSSKSGEVARSMVFLPTGVAGAPAVMVVFDKVTSKATSQTKKFLLHFPTEPTIEGNMTRIENTTTTTYSNGSVEYGGRLATNTLLPKNAKITKVAGTQTNGKTYKASSRTEGKYQPEWGRIEIQAETEGTTTHFLNVLTASDVWRYPVASTLIGDENSRLVGAQTQYNQVVMFANTGTGSLTQSADFTVASGEDQNFFIFGIGEGKWTVKKDSELLGVYDVEAIDGTITFSVDGDASGEYTVAPFDDGDIDFATVLWYDYRLSNGASQSTTTKTWYDLSENGNALTLPTGSNWEENGLYVNAEKSETTLPSIAKDTLNGSQYTLEFSVSNIDVPDPKKSLSILGDVRSNFAIHKIIGADKIYLKLPGWKSTLYRPYILPDVVDGSHHIITVNKNKGIVRWYVDGNLSAEKYYDYDIDVDNIKLISGKGSAVYQQIKLLNVEISETDAANEYAVFSEGFN